jgi:DNA polymerase-3 subunit delta'
MHLPTSGVFGQIAGHKRLAGLLSRAIARGTLPPTLLFVGPTGVGKWRMAVAVAQALNCQNPREASHHPDSSGSDGAAVVYDACGECRSCERIARGLHVDVIAVEPDERASIKIDVVRDVLSRTAYRPFEGLRRVVLVREADTLEPQAQNALLKSLEEPPPATVFILTTAVPGALLPTVRSRSMTLRFGMLTADEISEVLVRDHGQTREDALAVSALADGSVGQALALESADLAVLRETALLLLAETGRQADAAVRLRAAATVVAGESKKERSRDELAVILRLASSMLRDMEAINSNADLRVLANPVVSGDLRSLAPRFAGDRAREAFVAVDRALAALERNAGTKVVADWLAMTI